MTTRLRICLISEEFPPDSGWGGIGTYSFNLAHGLTELGHSVEVISRGWDGDVSEGDGDLRVHRLTIPEPSWRRGTHALNSRLPETRQIVSWNLRVAALVKRLASRARFDLVEAPEYHAQALAASLRPSHTPFVVRLHTPSFMCNLIDASPAGGSRLDTRLAEKAERFLTKRAQLVTCPSRHLAGQVAREWNIQADAIRVTPNPVDADFFEPSPVPTQDQLVLCVGRLERRKGVHILAAAIPGILRSCPGARFLFVGKDHPSGPQGGSMKEHLEALFAGSGAAADNVEFRDHMDRTELPAIYQSAAICVVPSLYENAPYTCVEAMACGTAVVASSEGGIPEMIDDGVEGILVPAGSVQSLAGAVTRLLQDRHLRSELGVRARKRVVESFGRLTATEKALDAYEAVLRETRGKVLDRV